MTREEAIKHLRNDWFMSLGGQLCVDEDKKDAFLEAVGMGIKALRPVSREQVERMRGEWIGYNDERVGTIDGSPTKSATCSVCGNWLVGSDEYSCAGHFCPCCGSPMTDEAVEMVMERLEALHENIYNG